MQVKQVFGELQEPQGLIHLSQEVNLRKNPTGHVFTQLDSKSIVLLEQARQFDAEEHDKQYSLQGRQMLLLLM